MLEIIEFYYDDETPDWEVSEPWDFKQWIVLRIGKDDIGEDYYVQLCTPVSIKHIKDKRSSFMIDSWVSKEDTIEQLNGFIRQKIKEKTINYEQEYLSKFWNWEYAGYNS